MLDDDSPYTSLVKIATSPGGEPVILVSRLAWHTRNLEADGRASVLFTTAAGEADPLQAPRATAIGWFEPVAEEDLRHRYIAIHPDAAMYAGFQDFSLWRMRMRTCHVVAGFGQIATVEANSILLSPDQVKQFAALSSDALAHMNADHAEALALYATRLLGQPSASWKAVALDPDGLDLSDGRRSVRLDFPRSVGDAGALRSTLKALADEARRR